MQTLEICFCHRTSANRGVNVGIGGVGSFSKDAIRGFNIKEVSSDRLHHRDLGLEESIPKGGTLLAPVSIGTKVSKYANQQSFSILPFDSSPPFFLSRLLSPTPRSPTSSIVQNSMDLRQLKAFLLRKNEGPVQHLMKKTSVAPT